MFIKLNDILRRRRRDQEGGVSAEYVAVIVIVAAVIAAVWRIGIDQRVEECGDAAVQQLFDSEATKSLECGEGE